MVAAIQPWKQIIDKDGSKVVGISKVLLDKSSCGFRECNLGNFVADAFVHYYLTEVSGKENAWNHSIIGLVPAGSVRTTLNVGRM